MSEDLINTGDQISEAAAPVDSSEMDSVAAEQEARQVPLDALQAERAERQKLQDELQIMKDHMALLSSSRQQQSYPQQKEEMDGLADDDVLTVGEAKKFIKQMNNQYKMSLDELRITQKYPDYAATVTKYLPEVLKQNPGLRATLEQTQDYELAYYLASNSSNYKKEHKSNKKNADAERIVQNATRAGSLSSVGQTSPISKAKNYKNMSSEEFQKVAQSNLGYY